MRVSNYIPPPTPKKSTVFIKAVSLLRALGHTWQESSPFLKMSLLNDPLILHANCLLYYELVCSRPSVPAHTTQSLADVFELKRATVRLMNLNDGAGGRVIGFHSTISHQLF
jgi:hypothetical protein